MENNFEYEEYIQSLLNAARLTNKANSILIKFTVLDEQCTNSVEFIQQDGTIDKLKSRIFPFNKEFQKELLEKFIMNYHENMKIAFSDSVDVNKDGKYTYRVVTEDNDMLSVDGISLEYANYLMKVAKKESRQ